MSKLEEKLYQQRAAAYIEDEQKHAQMESHARQFVDSLQHTLP